MGHLSFHRETPVGVVEGYCSVKDIVCVATIHADVAVAVAVVIEFADGALCPKVEVIALWNAPSSSGRIVSPSICRSADCPKGVAG